MPRPPSLTGPVRRIMSRELRRIEQKQLDAEEAKQEYVLTEADRQAVESAAKVGRLLEQQKPDEPEPDEKAEPSQDDVKAARERLEKQTGPAKVERGPDADLDKD